jgi:hypothetical protein
VADIFDELNEDLRAERGRALAMRYGGWAAGLLVLVLAGVGGWQGWHWYQGRQAGKAAAPYIAAMAEADALPRGPTPARAAAADAFAKVAGTSPEGYATLARLREAALRADAGDSAAALALWDKVAHDADADQILRDLATLLWAQNQVDHGDPAVITDRLRPLQADGNPWRPLAQEVDALLSLRQNDKEAAIRKLRVLAADPGAAEGVRGRASGLLTLLGDTEPQG